MGSASGKQQEVIEVGVASGVRHIDTAQAYASDALVGKILAQLPVPRAELFITSKVNGCASEEGDGQLSQLAGPLPAECAAQTTAQIATNLANLRVSYVDLMLIHFPPMPNGCATQAGCAVYKVCASSGFQPAGAVAEHPPRRS